MFLVLDTETGGKYGSLLSYALIVADENFRVLTSQYNFIKQDYYRVSPEAMSVNKLSLESLQAYGSTPKELGTKIYNFLRDYSNDGADKLIPVGFGLSGDVARILELISPGSWYQFVSYGGIDLSSVGSFLRIGQDNPGSLRKWADEYEIIYNVDMLHDAFYDANLTLKVLGKMYQTLQKTNWP